MRENAAFARFHNGSYLATQFVPTPFPHAYESRLFRAARRIGLDVPDIFERHRRERAQGASHTVCPPHDVDWGSPVCARVAANSVAEKVRSAQEQRPQAPAAAAAGCNTTADLAPPSAGALSRVTVGLVLVSHDAPRTLLATLASWAAHGLLDLADDRVAVLSAAAPEEIAACLAAGFRVYTAARDEARLVVARHAGPGGALERFGAEALAAFPPIRDHRGRGYNASRPATFVGPAQLLAYLEMAVDVVLFCEKDYVLPAQQTAPNLVRGLLAAVALLAGNTQVVRLRRMDDANREALPDCCAGRCGGGFADFGGRCMWADHLDWLALACDPTGVEGRSGGALKVCMDEQAAAAAGATGGAAAAAATPATSPSPSPGNALADRPAPGAHPVLTPGHTLAVPAAGLDGGVAWVEPLRSYCFSMDHSGWSNNVAAFRREFWVRALDHVAVLSGPASNGDFEVNAVLLCDYCTRHGCGSGPRSDAPPAVCQLTPGLFVHSELDGFD